MTLKGSPYSPGLQFDDVAESETRTPFTVHVRSLAWCVPKLWPSPCAMTRSAIALGPLSHERLPGMFARPAQPHPEAEGNAYTTFVYPLRFTPAADAAVFAWLAHVE